MRRSSFILNGEEIRPGSRGTIQLPLPGLYSNAPASMPVHVVHGKKDGPRLLVCAAIHGDEINGVEIIRRLLEARPLNSLAGTLVAVPVVNIYGFISHSRYLPDRRDLNRSFPGSAKGSLASRLAYTFINEIVTKCTHMIDLHTGAIGRENLPQIRAKIAASPETAGLARAFGTPVIINAELRDGSLREAAREMGINVLLYEAGEALRFDEVAIRAGVKGVLGVMSHLGMVRRKTSKTYYEPVISYNTQWLRAETSGVMRPAVNVGDRVNKGDIVAFISDPLGKEGLQIKSPVSGIVIGRTNVPLVNEGDAVIHIARFQEVDEVAENIETFMEEHDPLSDIV